MRILSVNLGAPGFSPKVLRALGIGEGPACPHQAMQEGDSEADRSQGRHLEETPTGRGGANAEDMGTTAGVREPKGPNCLGNGVA